ncbi:prepilin peptidase [Microvirga sp. 2TAF3]|uniref:prepilin peptidase n=1 Tax=Microvirga sp. 2TAF3 TaxID=3233014 RepID=UPI003F98BE51
MADDGTLLSLAALYLVAVSLAISIVDARSLVIPNALNAVNAGGGLAFAILLKTSSFSSSIIGGGVGFLALLAFRSGYRSIRGQDGLGLGDVKFMAGAGLWVGWEGLAPLLLVSSLTALLFAVFRGILKGHLDQRRPLPFGPFLCAGTLAVWGSQAAGLAPWVGLP